MSIVQNAAGRVASGFMVVLVGTALVAAACGGSSGGGSGSGGSSSGGSSSGGSGSSSSSGTTVSLSEFKITPAAITASSGATLSVQNTGTVAHDLVIQSTAGSTVAKTALIQPGASAQLALPSSVTAGNYTAICDVPGHKSQGMTATLTVS
jgi:plastocyanin